MIKKASGPKKDQLKKQMGYLCKSQVKRHRTHSITIYI